MATLSDEHFRAFGRITHYYASIEAGLKITIGGLTGARMADTLIMAEPYTSLQLKNVVKSLNREIPLPRDGNSVLSQIVGDFTSLSTIRNAIAHFRWAQGVRPHSIKPIHLDIRSGKAVFRGNNPEERDWTPEELLAEAEKLEALDNKLRQFVKDYGLFDIIEQNMRRANAVSEALGGIPASSS
jgi:hypothetical protein